MLARICSVLVAQVWLSVRKPDQAGQGACSLKIGMAPDEVFVKINGERRYLWRAADHMRGARKLCHEKERQESGAKVHEKSYAALWIAQRDRYR